MNKINDQKVLDVLNSLDCVKVCCLLQKDITNMIALNKWQVLPSSI